MGKGKYLMLGMELRIQSSNRIMLNTFQGSLPLEKGYPYEFSSHIPFIVSWPSKLLLAKGNADTSKVRRVSQENRGQKRSEVVELRDLFPTFLDIANGAEFIPEDINGSSILDLILSEDEFDDKNTCTQSIYTIPKWISQKKDGAVGLI